MSGERDPTAPGPTVSARPMTDADYAAGYPVRQARPAKPAGPAADHPVRDHPVRDLVIGAFVGAAALWAVPKLLDATVGGFFGEDDEDGDDVNLEIDP